MSASPCRLAAVVALLLICPAILVAQPPEDKASVEVFEEDLARVSRFLDRREYDRAAKEIDELFQAHADQDYVRARSAELVELRRRTDFGLAVESPDPKTLVNGDLKSFSRTTGRLSLEYDLTKIHDFSSANEKDAVDFITSDRLYIHKLSFGGSFTAEYSVGGSQAQLYLLHDSENAVIAEAAIQIPNGLASSENPVELVTAVVVVKNDKRCAPILNREPFRGKKKEIEIEFKVTSRYVDVFINGKKAHRVDTDDAYGRIALSTGDRMQKLKVSGKAEPAFLQDRIDAAVGDQRDLFNKSWKPKEALPDWVFEKMEKKLVGGVEATKNYAGNMAELNKAKVDDFMEALKRGDKRELDHLRRYLDSIGLDAKGALWLDARSSLETGEISVAIAQLEKLAVVDPRFLEGKALLLRLKLYVGRREEAGDDARKLIEDFPNDASAFEAATPVLLVLGRASDGKVALDQAFGRGIRSKELTRLNKMLVKALRGPEFAKRYEHKSKHYVVVSDIDSSVCRQAALALEQGYRSYEKALLEVEDAKQAPFEVFIFAGQSGYANYSEGTLGTTMAGSAGLFSPYLKQLLIWNVATRESMDETIRHEGFHQYLDRVLPTAPIWLNEGLAVYNETGKLEFGKWKTGDARRDYLRLFETTRMSPLQDFFKIDIRGFQNPVTIHRNYGQAWLIVHYLLHSNDERRKLFDDLVGALGSGRPAAEVVQEVFEQVDLNVLQTDLENHASRLRQY